MVLLPRKLFFFRKPIRKPCCVHSCLSRCKRSKSDVNSLMRYWQLQNTENSLTDIVRWRNAYFYGDLDMESIWNFFHFLLIWSKWIPKSQTWPSQVLGKIFYGPLKMRYVKNRKNPKIFLKHDQNPL